MIIGITINNVLRDHISQLKKGYLEITGNEAIEPINPYDLEKSFPTVVSTENATEFVVNDDGEAVPDLQFNEVDQGFNVYELMYNDAPFEIFGRSEESTSGIIHKLKEIEKQSKVEFVLLNKESPRSKCATLFFLSKNSFDFKHIYFPEKEKDFWALADVIVTDNPKILKAKPKNKVSIKVETEFNVDIKADFSIININDTKSLKNTIKTIKTKQKGK